MRTLVAAVILVLGACASAPRERTVVEYVDAPPYAGRIPLEDTYFSGLQAGDTLTLIFSSRGCFHDFAAELVFTPQPPGALVTVRNALRSEQEGLRTGQATVLTAEELLALDRQLYWHRQSQVMSTTRQVWTVTLRRSGELLRSLEVTSYAPYPPLRMVSGVVVLDTEPSIYSLDILLSALSEAGPEPQDPPN